MKTITDGLYSWCSTAVYSLTACQTLSTVVTAGFRGNLGLRAGAVCSKLGECASTLVGSAACSIVLVNGTAGAPLDVCTVDGVVDGSRVAGIFASTGESACIACECAVDRHFPEHLLCHVLFVGVTAALCLSLQ
jgi:hypothetical protein